MDTLDAAEFAAAEGVAGWSIAGGAAEASFATRTFARGAELVARIAELADAADHHPDVELRYRDVTVRTVTHSAGGLTQKDVDLARAVSAAAAALGAAPKDPPPAPDPQNEVDAFADRIMDATLGWVDLMAMHLGSQLGWYDALAARGPLTSEELAAGTATDARYAREWCEQQVTAGILALADAAQGGTERRFALPPAAREVLTDRASLSYLEPLPRLFAAAAENLPAILDAYRSGGGVSWEQLGVYARGSQADMNRPWFDTLPATLAQVPHVDALLSRPGARIADVGMGAGWSSIALAGAYPALAVDGFDIDEPSVAMARDNAAASGVADRVRFHREDAAALAAHGPFDAVFAFECLHDMPHPVEILAAMRAALAPGGRAIIMDEAVLPHLTPDAGPMERLFYGFSLFVCLPDGMSHQPTEATGTVMRPETLRGYARRAGWGDIRVIVPEFGLWRFYELVPEGDITPTG